MYSNFDSITNLELSANHDAGSLGLATQTAAHRSSHFYHCQWLPI